MCSIFGALGRKVDIGKLEALRKNAGDRGRDGGRMERYELEDGYEAFLGNWRATPTTELEKGRLQPYAGLVHNGTVANDKELGGRDDEIDSEVLARVLERTDLGSFRASLEKVKGSYAIGCVNESTVFLGCNYKPIHLYVDKNDGVVYFSSMARHFRGVIRHYEAPFQLPPYSVMNLRSLTIRPIARTDKMRAVVIASAGLDSTTVAWKLKAEGYDVHLLHFQYGCLAQTREVDAVQRIAQRLGAGLTVLPIPYTQMAGTSAIMRGNAQEVVESVEGAEYAHEWVPARNLVMLSLATAFAEANGYHYIALGNNLEESGAYPDNEEQFTTTFNNVLDYAVQNGYRVQTLSPLGHLMKHEIVKMGLELGVPYELTWSCYRDGAKQCGHCGPCFLRQRAFTRNGYADPVEYEQTLLPELNGDTTLNYEPPLPA